MSHFTFIIHTPLFAIMKTKKLLLLFAFIATMFTAFSAGGTQANEIIITGSSGTPNGPPRVPAAPSLEAYLDLDVITICFLNDLGNVTITITSETGETVYNHTVPTDYGVSETVDTCNLAEGSYFITITNDSGMWLQGEFQI